MGKRVYSEVLQTDREQKRPLQTLEGVFPSPGVRCRSPRINKQKRNR